MDVTWSVPTCSYSCLGRAHLLTKLVKRNYSIKMIGAEMGDSIWGPINDEFDYASIGVELGHVGAALDHEVSRLGGG
jgi:hypothetical protein